jgi:hypothetical protein
MSLDRAVRPIWELCVYPEGGIDLDSQCKQAIRVYRYADQHYPGVRSPHKIASPNGLFVVRSKPYRRVIAFPMFHFGRPRTPLQWIGHIVLEIVALLLVMWMLRVFVL